MEEAGEEGRRGVAGGERSQSAVQSLTWAGATTEGPWFVMSRHPEMRRGRSLREPRAGEGLPW